MRLRFRHPDQLTPETAVSPQAARADLIKKPSIPEKIVVEPITTAVHTALANLLADI